MRGVIEGLCKEIGFRFNPSMERTDVLTSFVSVLVQHIEDQMEVAEAISKPPSNDSPRVLARVKNMLTLSARQMQEECTVIHALIHRVNPEDAYPTDHYIDTLSSCVSAVRFGLDCPEVSRHPAEAAGHVWKQIYGVRQFDEFTGGWCKEWARAQLQTAIERLAFKESA